MRKFTIIIPTRERVNTLKATLQTCVAQNYGNLEIIVSDNYSQDATQGVVLGFNDPRIRYINTGHRLSMMENFEFAFNHVSDGYVCALGDDDGLLPGAIEYVNQLIEDTQCKAISCDFAHYTWPDVLSKTAGQLMYGIRTTHEVRSTKAYLHRTLFQRYPFNHLPCIYYGFVDASILKLLRQRQGRLFMTNIVDLYSSVALSLELDSYCFSFKPYAINGTSSKSNGASHLGISQDDTERLRWEAENQSTYLPPFSSSASIKLMLAEACYAIHLQNPSSIPPNLFNLQEMLQQAVDDVFLYRKSNINLQMVLNIARQLKLEVNTSRLLRLLAKRVQLYADRIPKYLHSNLIETQSQGVENISDAAILLEKLLSEMPHRSLISSIRLLSKRYKSFRRN